MESAYEPTLRNYTAGTYKHEGLETLLAKLNYRATNSPKDWTIYDNQQQLVARHDTDYLILSTGTDMDELMKNIEVLSPYVKTKQNRLLKAGASILAGGAIAAASATIPYLFHLDYSDRTMTTMIGSLIGITATVLGLVHFFQREPITGLHNPQNYLIGKSAYEELRRAERF